MRRGSVLGSLAALAASVAAMGERDARACGGCVPPPTEIESVITDEKMIYAISKDQTTLYDEIVYSGSPSSFAWVLPIKGTVTVGLSADVLFSTLESLTATEVVQPTPNCPPLSCAQLGAGGTAGSGGAGGGKSSGGGVTVLSQKQVGPYETVQLKSSDGSALDAWLASHGYVLPAADKPVIAAYVAEHFDFLALKLIPGAGVKAMQPVRVTSTGASISLPLHMVAIGTGPTTGITIWVVADGRWEPSNFPTFTIRDAELAWDWTTGSSNYESLRLSKEAALGGRGWQIESSLELSKAAIENSLVSAILYGPTQEGGYTPVSAPSGADGGSSGDASADSGDASAAEEMAATEDLGVLFKGIRGSNARITRMRSDVAHAALSNDMFLRASADQSEMTNIHTPDKQIGEPVCPSCGYYGTNGSSGAGPGNPASPTDSTGGCNTAGSFDDRATTAAVWLSAIGFFAMRLQRRKRPRR